MTERLECRWLDTALSLGVDDYDIDNMTDMMIEFDQAMYTSKFEQIENTLENLPLHQLSSQVLVSVLRSASPVRSHLPKWLILVEKTRTVLNQRGLDGARVLRGLF